MSDKRRHSKAQKEIAETVILVDYIEAHGLSYDELENFSESTIRLARDWYSERDK